MPPFGRAAKELPGPSWILLLAILALAGWLRFQSLGEVDLRGDEVTFFLTLEEGVDSWSYLVSHLRQFDHDRQMPIPRWLSATLVEVMGLPPTPRSARLFFALAGVATVVAFWLLGGQLARWRWELRGEAGALGNPDAARWTRLLPRARSLQERDRSGFSPQFSPVS